ncbi:MAG: glycosyltransferase [Lachnospiraceae bacterium]|nr:glycosyltransferase [Lachnospiraceae bacterium]
MASKAGVRISQCMIVKNEERNIRKALSWGKDIMWEQIVVDTGSTDRTVDIAREMGAHVCEFPWNDDFAAAKNYAIEQCKGDWIALLDADEYMALEDVRRLPGIIRELHGRNMDGLSTGWQQLDDDGKISASGTQVRFFRNAPDIRYQRRIHEQLVSTEGRELHLGDGVADLSIFHTGYQKENREGKKKSGRNRKLIQEELKAHPADYEMMGYLGDEYLSEDEKGEAVTWYLRSIQHMPAKLRENDQRSAVTFTRVLTLYSEQENLSWEQAKEIYQKAVSLLPKEADFDYVAGHFFAVRGHMEQAISHLETALQKLNAYGCNNRALLLAANLLDAYELLTRCCYEAGQKEKCASYGVGYLKSNPYNMAVLSWLLLTLLPEERQGAGEYPAILEFLSKIYDFSLAKDKLFVVKAAQMSQREAYASFTANQLFTQEEKMLLKL